MSDEREELQQETTAVLTIDAVEELRKELRNGRTTAASKAPDRHAEPVNPASGAGIPTVQRTGRKARKADGETADTGRSTKKVIKRVRQANGRFGKSDSTAGEAGTGTPIRRAGVLETDEPVPQRFFEPEKPQKKKEPTRQQAAAAKKPLFPWFKENTPLSKQESELLKEPLIAALVDDFGYIDEYIWWRTEDKEQHPVWSDVDHEEVGTLARLLLRRGEHSPAAATMVRAIVNGSDYISAAVILVPRVVATADRLAKAPKREKKKKEKKPA